MTGNLTEISEWMESYLANRDVAVAGAAADHFLDKGDYAAEALFRCRVKPLRIGRYWYDWGRGFNPNITNFYLFEYYGKNRKSQVNREYENQGNLEYLYNRFAELVSANDTKRRQYAEYQKALDEWENPYRIGDVLVSEWQSFSGAFRSCYFASIVSVDHRRRLTVREMRRVRDTEYAKRVKPIHEFYDNDTFVLKIYFRRGVNNTVEHVLRKRDGKEFKLATQEWYEVNP